MESMSLMHLLTMLIVLVAVLVPVGRILGRAGFSPWWCVLAVVPIVGLIGLWIFAFVAWPSVDQPTRRSQPAGAG